VVSGAGRTMGDGISTRFGMAGSAAIGDILITPLLHLLTP
jgi:hypothetical protein